MKRKPEPDLRKTPDFLLFLLTNAEKVVKIATICKDNAETKQRLAPLARRGRWKPFGGRLRATSGVTRDDRGGSSRYRASKMPGISG